MCQFVTLRCNADAVTVSEKCKTIMSFATILSAPSPTELLIGELSQRALIHSEPVLPIHAFAEKTGSLHYPTNGAHRVPQNYLSERTLKNLGRCYQHRPLRNSSEAYTTIQMDRKKYLAIARRGRHCTLEGTPRTPKSSKKSPRVEAASGASYTMYHRCILQVLQGAAEGY